MTDHQELSLALWCRRHADALARCRDALPAAHPAWKHLNTAVEALDQVKPPRELIARAGLEWSERGRCRQPRGADDPGFVGSIMPKGRADEA